MTAEEALAVLDQVLQQEHLSDVQEIVFRHCWEGQTYAEIAENAGYDTGYIKDVGSKLWQFLSVAFGEKVTKNNLQAVLRRHQHLVDRKVEVDQIEQPEVTQAPLPATPAATQVTHPTPHTPHPTPIGATRLTFPLSTVVLKNSTN